MGDIRGRLGKSLKERYPDMTFRYLADGVTVRCHCYYPIGGAAIRRSGVVAANLKDAVAWAGEHRCTEHLSPQDAYRARDENRRRKAAIR